MNRAESLAPDEAAAQAVKAYLRLYKGRVVDDAELLAALLPERFGETPNISDYQRFVIDRLVAENAILKSERDGLRRTSDRAALMRAGVRKLILDLIEARSFEETAAIAIGAAATLQADAVSIAIESGAAIQLGRKGICLLPPGFVGALLARDAAGALLNAGEYPLIFADAGAMQSVAIFRLGIGPKAPPALFALGARLPERFSDEGETREIAYFVRALERSIRAWLDLPKN